MRVVVDANVAIAAAATRGLCEAIMELCIEHHQLILCKGILDEIQEKLRDKLRVPAATIAEYVKLLQGNARMLKPDAVEESACRDPNDLMVLGAASAGNADFIVTGDKDLLVLKKYKGTTIVTPRAFWEINRNPA